MSYGSDPAKAHKNLEEALTLFFEAASSGEIEGRLRDIAFSLRWIRDPKG